MNNKGFTLIELLAVIVLIGIVATIGTTSIVGARRKINQKMVNTKLGEIITAAKNFGQDNKSKISNGYKMTDSDGNYLTQSTATRPTVSGIDDIEYQYKISVEQLIKAGYLESDEESCGIYSKCFKNNATGDSMNGSDVVVHTCFSFDSATGKYTKIPNRICACINISTTNNFGDTDTSYFDDSYSCKP